MPSIVIDYLKYICAALTICISGLIAIYFSINSTNRNYEKGKKN